MVKGTRTNRHRFQWGKIEEILCGNKSVGIRAELKGGKTRSGYITACKCGEKGLRTLIAIRKSGIRSQNIERGVDTEWYQESKGSEGRMDRSRKVEKEE